jgi:hypothetical protein
VAALRAMLRARPQAQRQQQRQALQARRGAVEDTNCIAGYRVLLQHLGGGGGGVSQRLLARGACACRAWRDESGAAEHNAVLRFDDGSDGASCAPGLAVVARALRRHAGAVRELHAAAPLVGVERCLPRDARFPRLALVRDASLTLLEHAAALLPLLRRAPRLAAWFSSPDDTRNLVPVALSRALVQAMVRDNEAREWRRWCRSIEGVHTAMADLLTPERGVDACCCESRWAPGVPGLLEVLALAESSAAGAHPVAASALLRSRIRQLRDDGESAALPGFMVMHLQLGNAMLMLQVQPGSLAPRWGTLLHKAAAAGNVSACAVLLRAGADPLARTVDERGGEHPCALQVSAANAAALCSYAEEVDLGLNSTTYTVLRPVALTFLASFWLLLRAAERRHGAAAAARALRGPLENALAAHAHAVERAAAERVAPRLALPRVAGLRKEAHARVREAEAYMRHGDVRAAGRGFLLRFVAPNLLRLGLLLAMAAGAAWLAWTAAMLALRLAVRAAVALVRALLLAPAEAALRLLARVAAAW